MKAGGSSSGKTLQNRKPKNSTQKAAGKKVVASLPIRHADFFFVRVVFQNFRFGDFLRLPWGWKKVEWTPARKKPAGGLQRDQEEIRTD